MGKTIIKRSIAWLMTILVMLSATVTQELLMRTKATMKAAGISYITLNTDDTWVSGEISDKDECDYYSVQIPSAGWLTVNYQGFSVRDSYIEIWDKDLTEQYVKTEVYTSSSSSPITKNFTLALEAGTYRIKIYSYGNNIGDYRLKASFDTANNNETESNNEFNDAMLLGLNQLVTGFLSIDDRVDFYKITVPSKKTVRLIYTAYIADSYFGIWDGNYINTYETEVWTASETAPLTHTYEQELTAGTYYIKITPYANKTGRYTLKYEEKVLANSIAISGKTKVTAGDKVNLASKISPSNTTDKTVYWSSGNTSVASVDKETGEVTTYCAGIVNITASAQDGSNVSKTYTIIVVPKKMSTPYLSKYSTRKMRVSWYSQSGVSGYQIQYGTNTKFTGASSKKVSNNYTSVIVSKLAKKRYYVRVRAYVKSGSNTYYGSWSTRAGLKMK